MSTYSSIKMTCPPKRSPVLMLDWNLKKERFYPNIPKNKIRYFYVMPVIRNKSLGLTMGDS